MATETEVEGIGSIAVDSRKSLWCPKFEGYFIQLVEEEVKKGNKRSTTLTKSAWKYVKEDMKTKTGIEYTQEQFKNKFNQLRKRWRNFGSLQLETGIGYNPLTGKLIASDDQWKDLCQKFEFAKTFRKKGCMHHDKLSTIFADQTIIGGANAPSTKGHSTTNIDGNNEENGSSSKPQKRMKTYSEEREDGSSSSKSRSEEETVGLALARALDIISKNGEKKLDLLQERFSSFTSTVNKEHEVQAKSVEALQNLKGIDASSFTKAFMRLAENSTFAVLFLQLTEERRRDVVINM